MHHKFRCKKCKDYEVDSVTFDKFISDELKKVLEKRNQVKVVTTATLSFSNGCPRCTEVGNTEVKLIVK